MSDDFMADREEDEELGSVSQKTILSGEKARSGETSGHLRVILGVSFALAAIALGILLAFWTNQG